MPLHWNAFAFNKNVIENDENLLQASLENKASTAHPLSSLMSAMASSE